MAYTRHYFPSVDFNKIDDEEFAILSEEALWLHQQMMITKTTQTILA
jgi:hypothetical protein|nr:MAG TPA: hypothetical protein [Caudoviricetes sp.]